MSRGSHVAARLTEVVLGAWLFISAFAWPHSQAQHANTWILGLLCAMFALIALRAPEVRYLNTVLAVWLFISCWALPDVSLGTIWSNALVAIALFFVSLAPLRTRAPAEFR